MKAVVTKDNFRKILSLVSHIVGSTATLPILSNILLQTDKGRIKISATNLEMGVTAWLGGRVEEEGSVTLPARTIGDYIATTLEDQISLETDDSTLTISTDSSSAQIKTLPAEDFPLIPQLSESGSISLPVEILKSCLSEVVFAAAPMETQPELAGVYVHIEDNKINFVSTDRYRLSERSAMFEPGDLSGEFKSMIIPFKTVQEVVRLLSSLSEANSKATLVQGENQLLFKLPDIELVSRLVDGQFPDYREIIPAEFRSQATLPRYELMQAVKSASLFASSARSIRVSFNPREGMVKVFAASGDVGESAVKVSGEVGGDEQECTFNYKYLLDYLGIVSDEKVVFKVIGDSSPAILVPTSRQNSLYLVMPVKV